MPRHDSRRAAARMLLINWCTGLVACAAAWEKRAAAHIEFALHRVVSGGSGRGMVFEGCGSDFVSEFVKRQDQKGRGMISDEPRPVYLLL